MKKLLLFFITVIFLLQFTPINAQESYIKTSPKVDSLKTTAHITDLYNKFFALEVASKEMNTEIDSTYEVMNIEIKTSMTGIEDNVGKMEGRIEALNSEIDSLLIVRKSMESINGKIKTIKTTQEEFESTVSESLGQLEVINKQQQEILDAQTAKMKQELEECRHRIVETAAFVKTANVSLNTLVLSNALTDYLNKVGDLNNPTNEDLGFSITKKVTELVETDIFKDKKKLGSRKKNKFLGVVGNLINNPITQTLTLGMSSVVTSLTGIDQMVTSTAIETDDVSVDELQIFRKKLKQYVLHYQALSHANTQFEHKLTNIKIRIEALQQLMKKLCQ